MAPGTGKTKPPERRDRNITRSLSSDEYCEGIWARHPLKPELGLHVAVTVPWPRPIDPGDRIRVRRRDGSESLETVKGLSLELQEPDGGLVGLLYEVEGA